MPPEPAADAALAALPSIPVDIKPPACAVPSTAGWVDAASVEASSCAIEPMASFPEPAVTIPSASDCAPAWSIPVASAATSSVDGSAAPATSWDVSTSEVSVLSGAGAVVRSVFGRMLVRLAGSPPVGSRRGVGGVAGAGAVVRWGVGAGGVEERGERGVGCGCGGEVGVREDAGEVGGGVAAGGVEERGERGVGCGCGGEVGVREDAGEAGGRVDAAREG